MLIIENANIGWAVIQQVIDRVISKLYYSQKSGEANVNSYFDKYQDHSKMVAGFTMSSRTRPMVIGKFQEYISDKGVTIQSRRLVEEMKTFIWRNGRPEAQSGYNDDLVMSLATAINGAALKFKQRGIDLTRQSLNNMQVNRTAYQGSYNNTNKMKNPYSIDTKNGKGRYRLAINNIYNNNKDKRQIKDISKIKKIIFNRC